MSATRQLAFHRLLCATDFSQFSTAAVTYAALMAKRHNARLRLVHVSVPFPIVVPYGDIPGNPGLYEVQNAQANEGLAAEADRVRHMGVTVEVEHRNGSPAHAILEAAEAWGADLIAVGTHGRSGFERLFLGSVAEKVLRKAACPVLTVPVDVHGHEADRGRMRLVLCPHDGSAASLDAVDYAVALARQNEGTLMLVSVVEPIPDAGEFVTPYAAEFRKQRESHAVAAIDAAVSPEVRKHVRVKERIVYGHPSQQILEVAQQEHADLIVMGVHGRGALDLMMFGSTTHQVVRHAHCPVLTVRPRARSGLTPAASGAASATR